MTFSKPTLPNTLLFAFVAIVLAMSCNNAGNNTDTSDNKTSTEEQARKRYVRRNVYDPAAEKLLTDMAKAYDSMRKMDCSNPLSWYYQGAIHQVPDEITGKNELCPSYQSTKDTLPAWDNCTHTGDSTEFWNFAVWHRLYTYHLEKIVRKLSGNPEFALPYWGYCDTVNVQQNRTMPALFRSNTSSLYASSRFDSLNNGQPVSGTYTKYLSLTKLFQNRDYFLFDQYLDFAPHGMMHNYIGGGNIGHTIFNPIFQDTTEDGGLMTQVQSAGFDPIFFVHHAEIDRIWQQWTNSARGKEITLEQMKASPWVYVFFDENGKRVVYTAEDVMKIIYTMDYDYDDTQVKPKEAPLTEKGLSFILTPQDTLVKQNVAKKVGTALKFSVTGKPAGAVELFKTNENKGRESKIAVLTIKVSFPSRVTGMYDVYVNLPAGTTPDPEGNYFAGAMNFFGRDHIHKRASHAHTEAAKGFTATFRFDMTDEFLATKALAKNKFDISIFKNHGRKTEELTIEEVTITIH
ncbi:MAG: tyrosinase family protein [Chitinophagaceae bacterium]